MSPPVATVVLLAEMLSGPIARDRDPDFTEPSVHAHEAVACPLHFHNAIGIKAMGVIAIESEAVLPLGGVGLFYERTLIRRWLELELSSQVLFAEERAQIPIDAVLKKPFHVSHRVDPYLGIGAAVTFGVGEERFVAPGGLLSAGFYVWGDDRWGALIEADLTASREPLVWVYEAELTTGPVVRF